MKLSHLFPRHAPETPHAKDDTFPESNVPAPVSQSVQSPTDSEPTKADEIMRLMAERKDRHKRAW